jgi:Tfp pilus assembly protein PilF
MQIDATHVGALCNYGLLKQTLLRDCAGAEDLYQRALAKDPTHVHSLFNLANLQREGNRMVEAMETYRRVLSIDCANVASMCNLAILEQRVCRNLPAAERYFMLCLECDPFHCAALANYASLKLEQRDSASAHRLYLRYIQRSGRALKWGTAVAFTSGRASCLVRYPY